MIQLDRSLLLSSSRSLRPTTRAVPSGHTPAVLRGDANALVANMARKPSWRRWPRPLAPPVDCWMDVGPLCCRAEERSHGWSRTRPRQRPPTEAVSWALRRLKHRVLRHEPVAKPPCASSLTRIASWPGRCIIDPFAAAKGLPAGNFSLCVGYYADVTAGFRWRVRVGSGTRRRRRDVQKIDVIGRVDALMWFHLSFHLLNWQILVDLRHNVMADSHASENYAYRHDGR